MVFLLHRPPPVFSPSRSVGALSHRVAVDDRLLLFDMEFDSDTLCKQLWSVYSNGVLEKSNWLMSALVDLEGRRLLTLSSRNKYLKDRMFCQLGQR